MEIRYFAIFCATCASASFAQELPPSQTVFFEKDSFIQPDLLIKEKTDTVVIVAPIPKNSSLDDQINQAILNKDWQKLELLLEGYSLTENYDQTLYEYALGALYRHQGRQDEAIKIYQKMIKRNPELHYPRFDLGMMLFEDKRYAEAKNEFERVKPFLEPQIQALIEQFLTMMKKSQAWQPALNLSFEKTDNVNQSSNVRQVTIGDATFIRDQDALPQKAQGMGYKLGVLRDKNITDNHYAYASLSLDGVQYWDNTKYSEQTWRADVGYRHKELQQSWGIIPFIEQNLLGDSRYSHNYGTVFEYNRLLTNRWQVSANATHIQKRYENFELAKHYNGHSNSQSALLLYQPKPQWLIYTGVDSTRDHLEDEAESSQRQGIRIGFLSFADLLSIRANLRYAERNFWADNVWYAVHREDNEYEFSTTAWRKQLQWKGFVPKLNYRYQKIDSNLPLYDRNSSTWYVTVEKDF